MARALPIRPEHPPDDATVVIRAGVMIPEQVRRAAHRAFAIYAVYGISIEGVSEHQSQTLVATARVSRSIGTSACRRSVGSALLASRSWQLSTILISRSFSPT
ncbi:MAG TPA: hypothetical protein VG435_13535 [Acidimicrobiales bacterium]|nr:hypothetical protein [Acidimicrobiales bacterium]